MPYVDQETRKKYSKYVKDLIDGSIDLGRFCGSVIKEKIEKQDGIMDYVITQGLRNNCRLNFIDEILQLFYCSEPRSWFRFQRLLGLLTAIPLEFDRRNWTLSDEQRTVLKLEPTYLYDVIISSYEDIKITLNGDLE